MTGYSTSSKPVAVAVAAEAVVLGGGTVEDGGWVSEIVPGLGDSVLPPQPATTANSAAATTLAPCVVLRVPPPAAREGGPCLRQLGPRGTTSHPRPAT